MITNAPVSDWPRRPLGKLLRFLTSGSRGWAKYYVDDGSYFLRIQNVRGGRLLLDDIAFVDAPVTREADRTLVQEGDVLLSITADLGRTAVVPRLPKPAHINQHLAILRPTCEVDPRFLSAFLESSHGKRQFTRLNREGVKAGLNFNDVRSVQVPLPPLPEQRRIAAILDKADAIRRKRREAIALTEELLRSTFLEMFGDPVSNPKEWPVCRLEDLLVFLTSGSRGWAKYYSDIGSLFLRIQNVRGGRLLLDDVAYVQAPTSAEARRTRVQPGDVLLSITADLGRTGVVPEGLGPAHINQHLAILRTDQSRVSPTYVAAFLESDGGARQFGRLDKVGVKSGLNFTDIKSVKVPLPPLAVQAAFVAADTKNALLRARLEKAADEADTLFHSLVQRAFRGDL